MSARSFVRPLTVILLLLALAAPAAAQTPLGATITGSSVQFAVFSQNATRIEVWLFSSATASTPAASVLCSSAPGLRRCPMSP